VQQQEEALLKRCEEVRGSRDRGEEEAGSEDDDDNEEEEEEEEEEGAEEEEDGEEGDDAGEFVTGGGRQGVYMWRCGLTDAMGCVSR
jgi:hypothetical protein